MNTKAQMQENSAASPPVKPLRKQTNDGLYARLTVVESTIKDMLQLTKTDFILRVRSDDAAERVPSECLLYFVRRPPFAADQDVLRLLFTEIRQRVLKAVPVPVRYIAGTYKKGESTIDLAIQEAVLDKFQQLLCQDRREYAERLDFFECRFNAAVARLRATARRDICNNSARYEPLAHHNEATEADSEVENPLAYFLDSIDSPEKDSAYRSKIHAAINSLPLNERRVIELFLEGIPIDSAEENAMTMVKTLKCCEKTVRNRRNRAFAKLAEFLKEENA